MDQSADIIGFIKNETGLLLNSDASEKIFRIISRQMKALGMDSPAAYLNYLKNKPDNLESKNIIAGLTVGETYFFRNKDHWKAFKTHVLPIVVKNAAAQKRSPRFWCAACATGEEAYTLAICIREEGLCQRFDAIRIFASDINYASVAKARKGIFNSHSFRGKEDAYQEYFEKIDKNYKIKEEFRRAVTFMELNLAREIYPSELKNMDVIFCRNALMYFCQKSVQQILKRIVNCLGKDGFLFLGHAETSIVPFDMLKRIGNSNTFFFQKNETHNGVKNDAETSTDYTGSLKPAMQLNSLPKTLEVREENKRYFAPEREQMVLINSDIRDAKDNSRRVSYKEKKETRDPFNEALDLYCRETYGKALKILTEHMETQEGAMNEIILAGMINLNMSRLVDAMACCEKALEKSDISAEGYCLAAMVKEAGSDFNGAIEAGKKAIFLDNHFFAPHFRLGQIYQKTGDIKKSRHSFLNGLKTLDKDNEQRIRLFFGILARNKLMEMCKEKCTNKKQESWKISGKGLMS